MSDSKSFLRTLLDKKGTGVTPDKHALFDAFAADPDTENLCKQILEFQNTLMANWQIKSRIADINAQQVIIPNGTVGKPYHAVIDFQKLGWKDVIETSVTGLEQLGLAYDPTAGTITGTPTASGDNKLIFRYKLAGVAMEQQERTIAIVINPDPKSLWKNIPSPADGPYHKPDDMAVAGQLGDKRIVIASKRGRSHANVGSYRDDDFAYKHLDDTEWSVVAVADGAGSAKISRKGSEIACNGIIDYFAANIPGEAFSEIDAILKTHAEAKSDETQKKLSAFLYHNLGKAALSVYKKLEEFAKTAETPIKDLHSTLIFALIKKYSFGYAILTFGVGDCPIGMMNKDKTEITLLNWLDVGEFGGGTRFITMPEIFQSPKFATRFGFRLVDDFSYLMLMTDGIYDPKFVVEANLEKIDNWNAFLADLNGKNDEGIKVDFDPGNKDIASQLSAWMDFWSPGNHDDRTLAIIY